MNKIKRRSTYENQTYNVTCENETNKKLCVSLTNRTKYLCSTENDDIDDDLLLLLTRHNWSMYRVSYLYKVEFHKAKLKEYAFRIKQELTKHSKITTDEAKFEVTVTAMSIIKNDSKKKGLQIEVHVHRANLNPVLKYKGVLFCWEDPETSIKNLVILPFLFCIGAMNVTHHVNQVLRELFDTVINPLRISEIDLIWLSAVLCDSENNNDEVIFKYNAISKFNVISASLPYDIVKTLWNHVHSKEEDEITIEEVETFYKQIQCQLSICYGINFFSLKLVKICTDTVIIDGDGKIRIHSKDAVIRILSFLNDVLILLDTTCPTMCETI